MLVGNTETCWAGSWVSPAPESLAVARAFHAMVTVGNRAYAFGGTGQRVDWVKQNKRIEKNREKILYFKFELFDIVYYEEKIWFKSSDKGKKSAKLAANFVIQNLK